MTKKCTKCCEQKDLSLFGKKSNSADGLNFVCKPCLKEISRIAYEQNKEKKKASANAYYERNKAEILAKRDPEVQKRKLQEWREANADRIAKHKKEYRKIHQDKIKDYQAQYRKANKHRRYERERLRMEKDPLYKLKKTIRKRNSEVLKNKGLVKLNKFQKYIGCSQEKLFKYIESQFKEGMTWQNHGKVWDLDHIVPLDSAKTAKRLEQLNHYRNLQPLFKKDNIKKSNKMIKCWQRLQREIREDEDREAGFNFDLSVSDFILNVEPLSSEHTEFIERYEWLEKVGYHPRWIFTARYQGHLAGIVMLSEPNAYQFGQREALIQRGAAASWAPKNLNSKLVMFACRWIVQNTHKRYFVAYSDPDAGEIGTIYQACNFDYLGQEFGAKYLYQLTPERQVDSRYFMKTSKLRKYAKILGIEWNKEWINSESGYKISKLIPQSIKDYARAEMKKYKKVKQQPKGKYVLLLNYGKDKLKKTWEPQPYPKRETGT